MSLIQSTFKHPINAAALAASFLCLLWPAFAAPPKRALARAQGRLPTPMVVQGTVAAVTKDSITLQTPPIRPPYQPGRPQPLYIIAGRYFKADISRAVFESPMGLSNAVNNIKVGDAVVVVAQPIAMPQSGGIPPYPITAGVVERIEIRTDH